MTNQQRPNTIDGAATATQQWPTSVGQPTTNHQITTSTTTQLPATAHAKSGRHEPGNRSQSRRSTNTRACIGRKRQPHVPATDPDRLQISFLVVHLRPHPPLPLPIRNQPSRMLTTEGLRARHLLSPVATEGVFISGTAHRFTSPLPKRHHNSFQDRFSRRLTAHSRGRPCVRANRTHILAHGPRPCVIPELAGPSCEAEESNSS